jgi:hypothetical protein
MVKIELINKQRVIKEPDHKVLMRVFGMIRTYPKNASFATQNEGEKIVIILRKHFIVNFGWIINTIFLFLAPTILGIVFKIVDTNLFQGGMSTNEFIAGLNSSLGLAFILFYYSLCVSMTLFNFLHWYFDLFIITNERFISISESINGFWPAIFGYGSIEFKTTSEKTMLIENIAQPTWFRDSFADLIKFIRGYTGSDPFNVIADKSVTKEKHKKNTRNLEP